MGHVLQFPNRPECPPHDWVAVYDEDLGVVVAVDEDDGPEYISGRICTKCSLIESGESLARRVADSGGNQCVGGKGSGGMGQGFFIGIAKPLLFRLFWYGAFSALTWFETVASILHGQSLRRQS